MFFFRALFFLVALAGLGRACAEGSGGDAPLSSLCTEKSGGVSYSNHFELPLEKYVGAVESVADLDVIRSGGFKILRIPVAWGEHLGGSPDYRIDPTFLRDVDKFVDQALARDFKVVLDLHRFDISKYSDREGEDRFSSIWKQLSSHYRTYGRGLVFELYNEPSQQISNDRLSYLYSKIVPVVRSNSPAREIVVSANRWSKVEGLKGFISPQVADVYLTVHYYAPAKFTHQGASWIAGASAWVGTKWEGSPADQKAVAQDLDLVDEWRRSNRVSGVFLGEFGVLKGADRLSRLNWIKTVRTESVSRGWCWAYWDFKAGFGAYDSSQNKWDAGVLGVLFGK